MANPSTYLLEIGTEELPTSFLETAYGELHDRIQAALEKRRLAHGEIKILETPRRLVLMIQDLALTQGASEELIKGPPISVALDAQGNPTPAGLGFAKKMGVDVNALTQENIEGTPYLVYRKQSSGETAERILPEILPDVVLGLSGSHFMSWDESEIKFSRPIRWILSMLNDKHLPLQIGLTHSGTKTYGHRFFSKSLSIEVSQIAQYESLLSQEGSVIVDHEKRKAFIVQGLQQKAKALAGIVPPNEALLDTVTMLVEAPTLIAGKFESAFLSLPKEVITTVMASHQKYFPVEDSQGKLMPYFITISNNPQASAESTIQHGNEKVLHARLEDANFFFQEDCKYPLSHFVERLKGITFQKGLGSLFDKTNRLKALTDELGKLLNAKAEDLGDAIRAAELCKADLATNMVRELTELQGVVGKHYAELSGEKTAVAVAISEHYQPRFMGDSVAHSQAGILLSLADKLDTMVAVFSQKNARYPTGSKDPMGLRRMALGIIQTVLENTLPLNLDEAIQAAYKNLGSLAAESEKETIQRVAQFLLQRLKGFLLDQNYPYDTIDAVLECDVSPLANLNNTLIRLSAIKALQNNAQQLKQIYEPANRIARILGKAYNAEVAASKINPQFFEDPSEKALFEAVNQNILSEALLDQYLEIFAQWAPLIEVFFNNVLVNVENPQVKENRYQLLSLLNKQYRYYADFTKLVV